MPKTKTYDDRKKVINELLRTRPYSLEELINRVSERIDKPISKKTIQNDIRAIRDEAESKGAQVVCKNGRYVYDPRNFNLYEVKASPDSIAKLKLAGKIIRQIPGLELHEDLLEICESMEMRAGEEKESDTQWIHFDTRPEYQGSKYLAELLEAVVGETVVAFDYCPFGADESKTFVVHPYLLKEWNNRWYLVGLTEEHRLQKDYEIFKFGLERIKGKVKPMPKLEFYRHDGFDAAGYFDQMIGISRDGNEQAEDVVIRLKNSRASYIETNPIHHSQKLIKSTKDYKEFKFRLIPNKELISQLLWFGEDLELLRPLGLRKKFKEKIEAQFALYKK